MLSKELRPYLRRSILFHAVLFAVFGIKVLIFPDTSDLDEQATIKVDMVALPNKDDNKVLPPPQTKPPKVAKKPEPVKPKVVQKPKPLTPPKKTDVAPKTAGKTPEPAPKETEQQALERLAELQALQKLQGLQAEEEQPEEEAPAPIPSVIKGNRLASGDSITGINKIQYTNYKKILHDAVKNKWNLPTWIQDGDLKAEALIKINETGYITEKTLIASSGNATYDKYVLQAITEASPFPAPPDKFVNIVGVKGVVLRFP